MYSRYVRDDRGTYTRVSAECAPPPPPVRERKPDSGKASCAEPSGRPRPDGGEHGGRPRPEGNRPRDSQPGRKPSGGERPCGEQPFAPPPPHPHERPVETGFLNRLLEQLHLGDIDSGDLLLLFLLFFLFKQKADEELLIAMGLLLIL